MVAINGNLCVVGSADTLKHEKITDNNCGIISSFRAGSSTGADGPRIYMKKGVKVDMENLRGYFANKHNAPHGSVFYATPNAYIND